jgi:hypothetical protein
MVLKMKLEELLNNKDLVQDIQDLKDVYPNYNNQIKEIEYITCKYGIDEFRVRQLYQLVNYGKDNWEGLGGK